MSCREYQHQIVFFLYEELQDGERAGLEAHLRECTACQDAFEEQKSLHIALTDDAIVLDPPADLLVESRKALANELDRIDQRRPWWRIPTFSVVFTPMRLLESAALVAMGLALGVYVSKQQQTITPQAVASPAPEIANTIPTNATVANIRIVDANARTGEVELAGEMVQPLRIQGNMDNEIVRNLTLSALGDGANPHSRLHAVEVLARKPVDAAVKEALIQALNDEVPAVRQTALQGLIPFAGEADVKAAFIQSLKTDRNEGIRAQIVETLGNYAADESVVRSIEQATKDDDSPYIRAKGLQFVGNHQ
jgi:HEAT repeat protein/putative zinc finger protein